MRREFILVPCPILGLTKHRAFVTFITAGFPTRDSTVPLMMALEAGGADIIELGMPFSDPIGDGPTIQRSNTVSPLAVEACRE